MATSLQELYKQTLLQHSKQPRNAGELADAQATATLRNPLCGDEITVYLKTDGSTLSDLSFVGQCCSICTASASMMTAHLAAKPIPEAATDAERLVANFKGDPPDLRLEGELAALSGVRDFPSRIRCATLPWEALQVALAQQ